MVKLQPGIAKRIRGLLHERVAHDDNSSLYEWLVNQPDPASLWKLSDRALLGAGLILLGEVEKGISYLLVSWSKADPATAGLAGAYLLNYLQTDYALEALEVAAEGLPHVAAHSINLGRCLSLVGRFQESICALNKGLAVLDTDNSAADHNLALRSLAEALHQLGRTEEALALLPGESLDEKVIIDRAALLAGCGRHDQAAVLLTNALQRQTDSEALLLMASDLAEVRGRTGEAIAILQQGLEQEPNNLALLLQLAKCGSRAAVPLQAQKAAEQAMALIESLDPGRVPLRGVNPEARLP